QAARHRTVALADLRQPTITHHASRAGACRFRQVVRLPLKAAPPINRAFDAMCQYPFNWRARRGSMARSESLNKKKPSGIPQHNQKFVEGYLDEGSRCWTFCWTLSDVVSWGHYIERSAVLG